MIKIEIRKDEAHPEGEFFYDLWVLALNFYPGHVCKVIAREDWSDRKGYPLACYVDDICILSELLPEDYNRNTVKQTLYRAFVRYSGRKRAWGILTGVRPTKIPLRMIRNGLSSEQIMESLKNEYLVRRDKRKLAMDVAWREYELTKDLDHERGYNLYIGIPFCPSICHYCSFSSCDYGKYRDRIGDYLQALEKEMVFAGQHFKDRELHSIYVGGGTPTALNEGELQTFLEMVHRYFPVADAAEFSLEAGRPDSISGEKLIIMKNAGVTRISINPQTMKQQTLDVLGRKHTVEQVREVFRMSREAGFDNINMDLIAGLPGEDEVDFYSTMNQVTEMEPDSVTVHTLVIKRASRLRREQMEQGDGPLPEDTLIPVLQTFSEQLLREQGYVPYYMYRQKNKAGTSRNTNQENVAYARPGKECLYNILMMEEMEDIVALGSGGSSKHVFPRENRMERVESVKNVEQYIDRIDEMIERKRREF